VIVLRLRDGSPEILEVDVGHGYADYSFERDDVARIVITAQAGGDLVSIDESNGAFTDSIPTTVRGGSGRDTLVGGSGAETLLGGDGNDSIDGNKGNDTARMGAGSDVFIWDPGDGSDVIEGQKGHDTMLFNGAAVADQVDLSANGARLRFFRNPGNITMDTAGVEQVDFKALDGADLVTVNDLTATGVDDVNLDLAGTPGGPPADDRIVVNGTNGNDTVTVSGNAGRVEVGGLAAAIAILHPDVANDRLEIETLEGTDTVGSGGLDAGAIQLFVDGVLVP
jgi:Ca2+-binding RTX toxin-like protein